jgi:glycosyltransferase involved in cell wall biosynthesis
LLAAMQLVKNPLITCDVYSSTQVYGDAFKEANDVQWQGLYEQAKQLPNVNYIGYKPNEYILENLHKYDAFVYPNIWEETFCISALESLAVGLFTVLTDNGALYETGAEFPTYIPMEKDYMRLAEQTAAAINSIPEQLALDGCQIHLKFQQKYFNHFYSWDRVAYNWNNFLTGALNARSK